MCMACVKRGFDERWRVFSTALGLAFRVMGIFSDCLVSGPAMLSICSMEILWAESELETPGRKATR